MSERKNTPKPARPRVPLPAGYRQAIVTAITVMLGFSLLFLRYWNFELPGAWSAASKIAAILVAAAIVLEVVALWRSLRVEDDDVVEYKETLRWFVAASILLLLGLLVSTMAYYQIFNL